jgi:hypothetical protein
VDSAGNIYVWDAGLRRVRKYSEDGRFLVQMGGDGGAPHEFSRSPNSGAALPLGGMALLGDSLVLIHDPWAPKLVFFDTDGDFHHDVPLHRMVQAARLLERISRRVHDLGGGFVLLYHQSPFGSRQHARPWDGQHALVRLSVDASSLDTLTTLAQRAVTHRWLNDRRGESFPNPFAREWRWAVSAEGRIAIGDGSMSAIAIHDRSWNRTTELRRDLPARPVTQADASSFRASFPHGSGVDSLPPGIRRLAADVLDELEIPTTWPFFDRLQYDDAGRLWVRRPPGRGDVTARWDVFDESLVHVATAVVPNDMMVMEIAGDRIYSLYRDQLDIHFVRVHQILNR